MIEIPDLEEYPNPLYTPEAPVRSHFHPEATPLLPATKTPEKRPFQFNSRVLSYTETHTEETEQIDEAEQIDEEIAETHDTHTNLPDTTKPDQDIRKEDKDLKTPAEYTLHIVFTQFVRHAERKLNMCLEYPLHEEPPIIELLAEGIDSQFDSIISSLGYLARRKPKPVIDSVMFWRKSKSEVASMAAVELERAMSAVEQESQSSVTVRQQKRSMSLLRTRSFKSHRRAASQNSVATRSDESEKRGEGTHAAAQAHETAVQAERKSLASIYILCRVLIEVVKQTSYATMGDDLRDKLEDIVYTQLKTTDPISTSQSLVRAANWNLFAELLGHMSEKSFVSVSDRFICDLEKMPVVLRLVDEPQLHLLIHGMRYLRLTNYPLEVFEESADFVLSLSKFFGRARNDTIVYAYCEILSLLLLPLAGVLTAETNHPTWAQAVGQIYERARQIWVSASVPLVWGYSLNLMTAALCVAPKELFAPQWFALIEANSHKLRQKDGGEDKATYVMCIARLMWVYVYRLPDTLNNTVKKLDALFGMLLHTGKKHQWLGAEAVPACVELVRIVGYHHLNYVLENVLLHMVKSCFNGVSLENLCCEKLMVAVRAYVAVLEDYENTRRPHFPDGLQTDKEGERPHGEFLFLARSPNNALTHEEICRMFATLLRLLDGQYGCALLRGSDGDQHSRAFQALHHLGLDFVSSSSSSSLLSKEAHVELFATLVEAAPWLVNVGAGSSPKTGVSYQAVVEMLCRNAVHPTARVGAAAVAALRRLAMRKNPTTLVTAYAKIAFCLGDKPDMLHVDYLNSPDFLRLLKVYVELLGCWLAQLRRDEPPQDATRELEWKAIITVMEDVEGNGLFFLCSQDSRVRHYGIAILRIVEEFDRITEKKDKKEKGDEEKKELREKEKPEESGEKKEEEEIEEMYGEKKEESEYGKTYGDSPRLIHILETVDFVNLIKPYRRVLSVPERTRLAKLKGRRSILVRLAESDYGIDSTLWFRVYPRLLDVFFERCPMPVAMCRSIVCVRLVQMHDMVQRFSDTQRNYTSSLFSRAETAQAPEVLVDQWRLYLIFACCSLTSTNDQKISFPNAPTHGRKRSVQMFIQHQKITSARSVFRMALPLLGSQQPMVREAVVCGLSCLNINIFRSFVESLPEAVTSWDMREERDDSRDRLRIGVVHILHNLTDRFSSEVRIYRDEWSVVNLVAVAKNVKAFLSRPAVQTDVAFQRLRRYFCGFLEHLFVGLRANADSERWFPFEARIACFNWSKEWCGMGPDAEVADERYAKMAKDAQAKAILEVERRLLEAAALACMGVMVGDLEKRIAVDGTDATVQLSFDVPALMAWIRTTAEAPQERSQDVGRDALRAILAKNSRKDVFDEVVRESLGPAKSFYFPILVKHIKGMEDTTSLFCGLLALGTLLVGCDDKVVRMAAAELISHLVRRLGASVPLASCSSASRPVYKSSFLAVSCYLCTLRVDCAHVVSHLFSYCAVVKTREDREDVFACLLPWLGALEWKTDDPSCAMVLDNLLEATCRHGHEAGVPALWATVGQKFPGVLEYVMDACLQRRSAVFVQHAREIVFHLVVNDPTILDTLVGNLQPRSMVPKVHKAPSVRNHVYAYHAEPQPPEKDCAFSLGQLSMVFAVDLLQGVPERLPVLLHVATVLLDHYTPVVSEQGIALLVHVVSAANAPEQVRSLLDGPLWSYDDLNNDKRGARTPKKMDKLVRSLLDLFRDTHPHLQEEWARVSLAWATTCAVRHIACRSFQVFRSLLSFLDQGMLKDMLHRLSNTISDETGDIQGFAMQILMTLNAITAELDSAELIDFPQLFWSGVACLNTIHEQEFVEVLSTMSKFISKIDLDAPDTVSCLVATFPPKWEGQFQGLHHVILPGLRSSNSWDSTLKFLDKLNTLRDSGVIGMGAPRLLTAILSNMPRYLHVLDGHTKATPSDTETLPPIPTDIQESALALADMASNGGHASLSRILSSLAKNRFRSKKDFLAQTVSCICAGFFPQYASVSLVLLLGLLPNKIPWVKTETMALLKAIFPLVDLSRGEFAGMGADLISPLLRLLLTDYAGAALEVLDEARVLSGSALDKDVLRMSFANTHASKEYDRTATLFGVPDENGWAVPMPAITAATTRNNIHAVFATCVAPTEERLKEDDIEFHMEDYTGNDSVSMQEPDASLSNVWAALDDFDSFFTRDVNHTSHQHSASMDTGVSLEPKMDSAPLVYEKKASVILNRSLARSQSNMSFKNSLADTTVLTSPVKRSYIPFRHRPLQKRVNEQREYEREIQSEKVKAENSSSEARDIHSSEARDIHSSEAKVNIQKVFT